MVASFLDDHFPRALWELLQCLLWKQDLQYRPYTFSDAEVIAGKNISVILTLLITILPLISYSLCKQGGFKSDRDPAGNLCALILLAVLFLATIILSHLITKTLFLKNTTLVSQHHQSNQLPSVSRLSLSNLVQAGRDVGWADIPIAFRLLLPFISLSSILWWGSDPWPLGLDRGSLFWSPGS